MNNSIDINSAFPFNFCRHCEQMKPEAELHTLYADNNICLNTVTVYCENESICQYVGHHILLPDPEEASGE